jgi:hypothetical protein
MTRAANAPLEDLSDVIAGLFPAMRLRTGMAGTRLNDAGQTRGV